MTTLQITEATNNDDTTQSAVVSFAQLSIFGDSTKTVAGNYKKRQ